METPAIIAAFREIDRKDFVLPAYQAKSHSDKPLSIGYGQTISQPTTVAIMLELLSPQRGEKFLDVGSGSGWTTALLARIGSPAGKVYALERLPEIAEFGEKNVAKYGFIKKGIVRIFCRDGYLGLPEYAPFDRILVSAAAEKVPDSLLEQLKIGGRMVIPISKMNETQEITVIDRHGAVEFEKKSYPGFFFVPLLEGAA